MIGAVPVAGGYFDGLTARRHSVLVSVLGDPATLVISRADRTAPDVIWPLDRLRRLGDQADQGALTLTILTETEDESPRDPARLVLNDPDLVAWLKSKAPGLDRREVHKGTWGRLARNIVLAAVAVVLMLFMILPRLADFMADILPRETEIRFGKSVVVQMERFLGAKKMGELSCNAPEGQAALDRLVARLTAGRDLDYTLDVSVMNNRMVNAFAAPGGHVVLVRGLLDKADSPEEVAGVLAHEIGHVEARDPTRLLLRSAGSAGILSLLLGDVSGGLLAAMAEMALQSAYSREAESAADMFGLELLNDAGVSSTGFADFFERIAESDGLSLPEYLASHPNSKGRAEAARVNAEGRRSGRPILTDAEWRDLRAICDSHNIKP
ncbi:MAG: M48 family metallopeptidase [Pseudorhodobacter sp.]